MPKPDPHFEVPPEYAEVYESAFRRASGEDADLAPGAGPGRGDRPPGRRPGRLGWALLAVALVLLALAGAGVFGSDRATKAADPAAPAPSTGSGKPSAPAVGVGTVQPSSATATCSPPTVSGLGGRPQSFAPGNAIDADSGTSWGCEGTAEGAELVLRLPTATRVDRVGLLPATQTSGLLLNRVTAVSWTFDDGVSVRQDLAPSDRPVVTLAEVPTTTTRTVRMRLIGVSPGPVDITAVRSVFLSGPS